jgi:hypothetical protein
MIKAYFVMVVLALVNLAMHFIAPLLVPIALLFAQRGRYRTKLPWIFNWLETPDEWLPGDRTIPAVRDIYDKWGWFICSWYWLGFRNVAFGISWQFGKPATNYLAVLTEEEQKARGVFEHRYKVGFIELLVGYAIYKDWYSTRTVVGFWAVPRITVRFV